ncbi:hypothetical protein ACXR6G_05655 [Ancylomarina sp. YFZ004]
MKLNIKVFLQVSTLFLLVACTSQSKICYVDNVQKNDKPYKYYFRQNQVSVLLELKKSNRLINYHILDTTILISQYIRDIDKEFREMKLNWEKQISLGRISKSELDSAFFYSSQRFTGQNCYSYAMEMFCKHNAVNPHPFFDSETFIKAETYHFLLETFKLDRKVYSWKEYKRKRSAMPPEAMIALKCKGVFTHGLYYKDGFYHSKNGYSRPAVFPDLKSIVKSYKYTDTILVYTPNKEKLLSVVEHL